MSNHLPIHLSTKGGAGVGTIRVRLLAVLDDVFKLAEQRLDDIATDPQREVTDSQKTLDVKMSFNSSSHIRCSTYKRGSSFFCQLAVLTIALMSEGVGGKNL